MNRQEGVNQQVAGEVTEVVQRVEKKRVRRSLKPDVTAAVFGAVVGVLFGMLVTSDASCGGNPRPSPDGSVIVQSVVQSVVQDDVSERRSALDGTPDFPIPLAPSHSRTSPDQYWPYVCANYASCYNIKGGYDVGRYPNRCPCVFAPPPGCRLVTAGAVPGPGETLVCTGLNLTGQCLIVGAGVRLDYYWMALAGLESRFQSSEGFFNVGPQSMQSGPHTQTAVTTFPNGFSPGVTNYQIFGGGNFQDVPSIVWKIAPLDPSPTNQYGWIAQVYSRVMPVVP